jgi:hypothetical protein
VDPISIAILGSTALKAGLSFFSSRDAADRQRRETDEAVRRLKVSQDRTLGDTTARGAASGIEFGSESLSTYLRQMSAEFEKEATWMRKSGYQEAGATEKAGTYGLLGDLGGGIFKFGAMNGWYK